MGTISSGTGEEVTQDSVAQGKVVRVKGADAAKSAARNFLDTVKDIEVGLLEQVATLEGQVTLLSAENYGLKSAVESLKKQLSDAKKDCHDPDSPEAMAGEVTRPPTNSQGTVSGSGPF